GPVSWLSSDLEVDGYRYPAGSLVAPYSTSVRPIAERIATELGLRVAGIKRKPSSPLTPIGGVRIALYKPWVENPDEGWTRWLLDNYEFRYASITDMDIRLGGLRARYDAIILPSASAAQLRSGNAS